MQPAAPTTLLHLPHDVIQHEVAPHLDPSSIRRLSRVNRQMDQNLRPRVGALNAMEAGFSQRGQNILHRIRYQAVKREEGNRPDKYNESQWSRKGRATHTHLWNEVRTHKARRYPSAQEGKALDHELERLGDAVHAGR